MHSTYNLFPCTCKCENNIRKQRVSHVQIRCLFIVDGSLEWHLIFGECSFLLKHFLFSAKHRFKCFAPCATSADRNSHFPRRHRQSTWRQQVFYNVTETMPLSQQLSGLLEKSVSVKASQPKCTIYFFLVANFFILLLSYL